MSFPGIKQVHGFPGTRQHHAVDATREDNSPHAFPGIRQHALVDETKKVVGVMMGRSITIDKVFKGPKLVNAGEGQDGSTSSGAREDAVMEADFRAQGLEEIPIMTVMKDLKRLHLDDNELKTLPDEIGSLTCLVQLTAKGNGILKLPSSLGKLRRLRLLDLSMNELKSLPSSMRKQTALRHLLLRNNVLETIERKPKQTEESHEGAGEGSSSMDVSTSTCVIPVSVEFLDLQVNCLQSLPDSFGILQKLTVLRLAKNQLSHLPESFGNLTALEELDLSSNTVEDLPPSFSNLVKLRSLSLSHNSLETIPEAVFSLSTLGSLDFDSNKLTTISENISQLQLLKSLTISNNQLDELPATFSQLTNLSRLDMHSNNISTLPKDFAEKLRQLAYWSLWNNPLARKVSVSTTAIVKLTGLRTVLLEEDKSYLVRRWRNQLILSSNSQMDPARPISLGRMPATGSAQASPSSNSSSSNNSRKRTGSAISSASRLNLKSPKIFTTMKKSQLKKERKDDDEGTPTPPSTRGQTTSLTFVAPTEKEKGKEKGRSPPVSPRQMIMIEEAKEKKSRNSDKSSPRTPGRERSQSTPRKLTPRGSKTERSSKEMEKEKSGEKVRTPPESPRSPGAPVRSPSKAKIKKRRSKSTKSLSVVTTAEKTVVRNLSNELAEAAKKEKKDGGEEDGKVDGKDDGKDDETEDSHAHAKALQDEFNDKDFTYRPNLGYEIPAEQANSEPLGFRMSDLQADLENLKMYGSEDVQLNLLGVCETMSTNTEKEDLLRSLGQSTSEDSNFSSRMRTSSRGDGARLSMFIDGKLTDLVMSDVDLSILDQFQDAQFAGADNVHEVRLFSDHGSSDALNKAGLRRGKKEPTKMGGKGVFVMEDRHVCLPSLDEDKAMFCVFDGHAGPAAAEECVSVVPNVFLRHVYEQGNPADNNYAEILHNTFVVADQELPRDKCEYQGCTGTVALVWKNRQGDRFLQVADVGDSYAFLFNPDAEEAIHLTQQHSLEVPSERDRITAMGVELYDGQTRVAGLKVTRALGDLFTKQIDSGVIAEPYVSEVHKVQENSYLVVASDGLWDVISGNKAMTIVRNNPEANCQKLAEILVKTAVGSSKCHDNVTVVVVKL